MKISDLANIVQNDMELSASVTESALQNLLSLTATSPLVEADPKSLDELMVRAEVVFNKRPILGLTDEEIDIAKEYYRSKRARFAQLARERENAPKTTRRRGPKSISEALDNISEIDL